MSIESDKSLPAGFGELEPFVADWAVARSSKRATKRWASDMDEINSFYTAMLSHLESALDHLDTFDLDTMPEPERRLFHLTLSLAEIAGAVEVYAQPRVPYAFPPERYRPTESD